jgi:hypothetical protein
MGSKKFGSFFTVLSLVALNFILTGTAHASLLLNVDAAAETYSFSGATGLGTPGPSGSFGQVVWGTTETSHFIFQSDLFSITGNSFLNLNISTLSSGSAISGFRIGLGSKSTATTITGTGNTASFATWSAQDKAALEASNGLSFNLASGTGFGTIDVSVTNLSNTVPEPPFFLTGLALFAVSLLRRNKLRGL